MTDSKTNHTALEDGAAAARDLADALQTTGILLPSLRGDFPVGDRAHVQLGGASAVVIRGLAAWIRERA